MPFFRRDADAGGGGGIDVADSVTRGRFDRREDAVFVGSSAGGELESCAGALRFREDGSARGAGVVVVGAGAAVPDDDSEELAALEEALVTLEDMICEYGLLIQERHPSTT